MGFWSMALFILLGINLYIGWRVWRAFSGCIPRGYGWLYWAVFLLFASSYMLARRFEGRFFFSEPLAWFGSYSVAFLIYTFLVLLPIDLALLLDRWLRFIPQSVKRSPARVGVVVAALLVGLMAYGTWNALTPVFNRYEIKIPKSTGGPGQVQAIMVSDLHLGRVVDNDRLKELVDEINRRNPDIVLIAGDIIDGDLDPFIEQDMASTLRGLKPRLGTYAVLGNHDNREDELVEQLQSAGVTVLRDRYQLIEGFYLAGVDYRGQRGSRGARAELSEVMAGIDRELPIILLNHSPANLEEARVNRVDLQLSGHTHRGQLFPGNIITGTMYEEDWGYLHRDGLQVIVSSGFGTWGPPIRIGNRPEVVEITINFFDKT